MKNVFVAIAMYGMCTRAGYYCKMLHSEPSHTMYVCRHDYSDLLTLALR